MYHELSELKNYDQGTLKPFVMFNDWLNLAIEAEPNDPSAMSLSTVDEEGMPNVRIVLMRKFDQRGFCFFTNFESDKGRELLTIQKAALNFHWKTLRKQIRIRGLVEPVRGEEADDYFSSRARGSQIASSASDQSRPLPDRQVFVDAMAKLEKKYEGQDVPRPQHWSGFRIMPLSIEFWDDGEFRTHDRLRFNRANLEDDWVTTWLYP